MLAAEARSLPTSSFGYMRPCLGAIECLNGRPRTIRPELQCLRTGKPALPECQPAPRRPMPASTRAATKRNRRTGFRALAAATRDEPRRPRRARRSRDTGCRWTRRPTRCDASSARARAQRRTSFTSMPLNGDPVLEIERAALHLVQALRVRVSWTARASAQIHVLEDEGPAGRT